jgi:preprotein translocase subunit YajC
MFFLIIMLTITLYYFLDKQKKVSQEFEAYLKSVENDPSLLTDQKFISG